MSPSKNPENRDISRADTRPNIPEIDNHPGIIDCPDEQEGKITARSIPPAALAPRGTFEHLMDEVKDEHQMQIRKIATYLKKLSSNSPSLHAAALSDMSIFGKLLSAANILEKSQKAIRLLEFNVRNASMGVEMSDISTEEGRIEAINEAGSSIRALKIETERTAQELEGMVRQSDEEDNRLVPPLHPGAESLAGRHEGYFNALVSANEDGVVKGTRNLAADCLDSIHVAVDRLVDYASREMEFYATELNKTGELQAYAAERPDFAESLLKHYRNLLSEYEDCLGFTKRLIGGMPLLTQEMMLDQFDEGVFIKLQNQLVTTLKRYEGQALEATEHETIEYLKMMLHGVMTAREQKRIVKDGLTLELSRGDIYLGAPRAPQIANYPLGEPPKTKS